jgi:hypothetical protein
VSRHRVRSSGWPYAAAAIVFGALSAWLLFGRTDDVTQVRLPDSTSIVVTKTTTSIQKVLLPDTTTATTNAATTTAPQTSTTVTPSTTAPTTTPTTTTATTTASTNAASQAPVPGQRVAAIVVVDATGQRPIAARTAMRLIVSGWSHVANDTADQAATVTRVLALTGFEDAGRMAVDDLGLAIAVEPLTDRAAFGDGTADIVVLLGQDATAR